MDEGMNEMVFYAIFKALLGNTGTVASEGMKRRIIVLQAYGNVMRTYD